LPSTRTPARLMKYIEGLWGVPTPVSLDRVRGYLLATKVEDRFGNTVHSQYHAPGHRPRSWSNRGRETTLTSSRGRLASATSHGRTWRDQYDANGQLSAVVRPDSSRWQYSYTGSLFPYTSEGDTVPPLAYCMGFGPMLEASYTLDATHPSGATGQF